MPWAPAARQLAANNLNPLFIHCSSFRHFLSYPHLRSSTNLASSSSHTTLPPLLVIVGPLSQKAPLSLILR